MVDDIVAAREELIDRGVGVSSIRHKDTDTGQWLGRFHLGPDPQRGDYASFADFADPDGNAWVFKKSDTTRVDAYAAHARPGTQDAMTSSHGTDTAGQQSPSVLVFDVNETLLDITALEPFFARVFGDPRVLREWFGQLVTYSMTVTLSGVYTDFFSLGQAVLKMLADIHGVQLAEDDVRALRADFATMPAHGDVAEGLGLLRDMGFSLVTLTNSPTSQSERHRCSAPASATSSSKSSASTRHVSSSRPRSCTAMSHDSWGWRRRPA